MEAAFEEGEEMSESKEKEGRKPNAAKEPLVMTITADGNDIRWEFNKDVAAGPVLGLLYFVTDQIKLDWITGELKRRAMDDVRKSAIMQAAASKIIKAKH